MPSALLSYYAEIEPPVGEIYEISGFHPSSLLQHRDAQSANRVAGFVCHRLVGDGSVKIAVGKTSEGVGDADVHCLAVFAAVGYGHEEIRHELACPQVGA